MPRITFSQVEKDVITSLENGPEAEVTIIRELSQEYTIRQISQAFADLLETKFLIKHPGKGLILKKRGRQALDEGFVVEPSLRKGEG